MQERANQWRLFSKLERYLVQAEKICHIIILGISLMFSANFNPLRWIWAIVEGENTNTKIYKKFWHFGGQWYKFLQNFFFRKIHEMNREKFSILVESALNVVITMWRHPSCPSSTHSLLIITSIQFQKTNPIFKSFHSLRYASFIFFKATLDDPQYNNSYPEWLS